MSGVAHQRMLWFSLAGIWVEEVSQAWGERVPEQRTEQRRLGLFTLIERCFGNRRVVEPSETVSTTGRTKRDP
jgi:hypothetical protein